MALRASTDPQRTPAGDRNRRMALGLSLAAFAEKAGITASQLHDYESTAPGDYVDANVVLVVGLTLDQLEQHDDSGPD
jgi:transcriptional regulator with XRE-family HTH domain